MTITQSAPLRYPGALQGADIRRLLELSWQHDSEFPEVSMEVSEFDEHSCQEKENEGDLVALIEACEGNYRKKDRVNDFVNRFGVITFLGGDGKRYTRFVCKFSSMKNLLPFFTRELWKMYFTHTEFEAFHKFIVLRSKQGEREWGSSLNLAKPADLLQLLKSKALIRKATEVLADAKNPDLKEKSYQSSLISLLQIVLFFAGWNSPSSNFEIETVAGGHIAYERRESRDESSRPAPAVGSRVDVFSHSRDKTRKIAIEAKTVEEMKQAPDAEVSATSGSALVQMLTAVIGLGADIGLIAAGPFFGVYWLEKVKKEGKLFVKIHKLLDVHEMLEVKTPEELLRLVAYLAFFVADPLMSVEDLPKKPRLDDDGNGAGQSARLTVSTTQRVELRVSEDKDMNEGAFFTPASGGNSEVYEEHESDEEESVPNSEDSLEENDEVYSDAWEEFVLELKVGPPVVCVKLSR